MSSWWSGTVLVLGRALAEHVRSKTFKIVTTLMLLLAIAAVTVPQLIGGGPATYTLATVGKASSDLVSTLEAAARNAAFEVRFVERSDEARVREAVRGGDATVGLAGGRLYVPERGAGPFPVIVSQSLVSLETTRLLAQLGLSRAQIAQLQSVRPPEQVQVGAVQDTGRATVGYAVGLVLYLALLFSGSLISTTVATEKASRISEVLLAVLRPSQVLVGNVLAVGVVTILQLVVLGAPVAVAASLSDASWLPSVAAVDIVLAVIWFLLGFALFGFLYAAGGALVDKVTEAGMAVLPVTTLIIAGYMLGIVMVQSNPGDLWSVVVSMFPLSAPLTMPIRWAAGEVPVWQLVLAMGLTAGAALVIVWLASAIYRRALVITGHRVRLRELLGHRERS